MTAKDPNEMAQELERLRRELRARDGRLAEKECEVSRLRRRLEDLQVISESRAARLAEKEREASELKGELSRRTWLSGQVRPGGGAR
jgi:predicted nuclease with TOPRIM domain